MHAHPPSPPPSIRTGPHRGCKGPICIRTWNRGDASSIISLGISQRLLEKHPPAVCGSINGPDDASETMLFRLNSKSYNIAVEAFFQRWTLPSMSPRNVRTRTKPHELLRPRCDDNGDREKRCNIRGPTCATFNGVDVRFRRI